LNFQRCNFSDTVHAPLTLNFQRCNFSDTVHAPTATLHTI